MSIFVQISELYLLGIMYICYLFLNPFLKRGKIYGFEFPNDCLYVHLLTWKVYVPFLIFFWDPFISDFSYSKYGHFVASSKKIEGHIRKIKLSGCIKIQSGRCGADHFFCWRGAALIILLLFFFIQILPFCLKFRKYFKEIPWN